MNGPLREGKDERTMRTATVRRTMRDEGAHPLMPSTVVAAVDFDAAARKEEKPKRPRYVE